MRAVPLSLKGIWDSVIKSSVASFLRGSFLQVCIVLYALVLLRAIPSAHVAARDSLWKTCFGSLRKKDRDLLSCAHLLLQSVINEDL